MYQYWPEDIMPDIKKWVTKQDGLDNLRLTTGPMPEPQNGEVLVKINSVSLNYRDTEVIMGLYNHHKSIAQAEDLVPCSDICGTIVKAGGQWKAGQRVMAIFNQSHLVGQIKESDMASGL